MGLIEIKVGGQTLIDECAATLKALKAKINQDKMNEPAFLAIITATDPICVSKRRRHMCYTNWSLKP